MSFQQDPILWEEAGQARYATLLREAEQYRFAMRAQRSSGWPLNRLASLLQQFIEVTVTHKRQPRVPGLCSSLPSEARIFDR